MSSTDRAQIGDPSLDAIEARSEHLRAGLADTVGELRSRLSPETIKTDVKETIAQSGQDLLAKLERSARENPLQTAAIGAGLAYPIVGILKSIPAPILLMGAGVALSGRNNVFSGLISGGKVNGVVASSTDKTSELVEKAKDNVAAVAASVAATAQGVSERVTEAASGVSDATDAVAHHARMKYHDTANAVGEAAESAAALGRRSRDTLVDSVQRNPLLAGALTALAGAALASFIPASRTESRLFGDASSRVKERTKTTAQQGLQAAMDAGERVVTSTLKAAGDEGLHVDAGRDAMRDLGKRATAVVDAGVKAVVPENDAATPVAPRSLDR